MGTENRNERWTDWMPNFLQHSHRFRKLRERPIAVPFRDFVIAVTFRNKKLGNFISSSYKFSGWQLKYVSVVFLKNLSLFFFLKLELFIVSPQISIFLSLGVASCCASIQLGFL
jgi:hypothetical protein